MKAVTYEQIIKTDSPVFLSSWHPISAIPLGVLMTCALLYAMQYLIKSDFPDVTEKPKIVIPEFTSDVPKVIPTQENELPRRPELVEQPEPLDFVEPAIANVDHGTISAQPVNTTISITQGQGDTIIGQLMPIVRINPNYPASAASRNIEGYVDVVFDITPIGTTTNIRIVGYSPSKIFNSSVLKAVRGWKYRAAADETGAQMTRDVKERISFVLEN